MRILYLCHRVPYPPNKGEKIRAFHELCALSSRHEVDLFTLADDPSDLQHRSELARICRRVVIVPLSPVGARLRALPYLLTRSPLTIPYFYSAELARELSSALGQRSYDQVFVFCSAMAQYFDDSAGGAPVSVDLVDVDSNKWTQYAGATRFPYSAIYGREGKWLRQYESHVCSKASSVFVTTEREARLVREMSPGAPVHVIPNGVDTEYFSPLPQRPPVNEPVMTFIGDMSYFPNQEAARFFALEVLPVIQRSVPQARFQIVGHRPGRKVLALSRLRGVEVTGFVPDIRDHLRAGAVSVAPFSIAAGIQNKVLEAMACGVPVVATRRAIQGLSKNAAAAVDTGNTAEELAGLIVPLLQDRELATRKGLQGRGCVKAEYDWDRSLGRLLDVLDRSPNPERAGFQAYAGT